MNKHKKGLDQLLIVNASLGRVLAVINEMEECEIRAYECARRINLVV